MNPHSIQRLGGPDSPPEVYTLPAEKLLAGNPKQSLWQQYTDASGCFFAGLWRSEVGKWHIAYTEEEVCVMLEGVSIITDEEGVAVTVVAGDRFVIPRGFTGTWEVVQPSTKTYVIYEPASESKD